jgi:adenine-specific DNA-methyltransferase
LQDKLGVQKQIRALESQRNDKRRALFDAQDAVDKQRDTLIAQIEGKLTQHMDQTNLFLIRWTLA